MASSDPLVSIWVLNLLYLGLNCDMLLSSSKRPIRAAWQTEARYRKKSLRYTP